jgi:hypothetical protein
MKTKSSNQTNLSKNFGFAGIAPEPLLMLFTNKEQYKIAWLTVLLL